MRKNFGEPSGGYVHGTGGAARIVSDEDLASKQQRAFNRLRAHEYGDMEFATAVEEWAAETREVIAVVITAIGAGGTCEQQAMLECLIDRLPVLGHIHRWRWDWGHGVCGVGDCTATKDI